MTCNRNQPEAQGQTLMIGSTSRPRRYSFGFRFLLVMVLTGVGAASASADIYSDCLEAIDSGNSDEVDRLATAIKRFNSIPISKRDSANACVTAADGVETVYDLGLQDFVPLNVLEELRRQQRAEQQELEQQREQREQERAQQDEAIIVQGCAMFEQYWDYQTLIFEAEKAAQARRIETFRATEVECTAWFSEDPRAALTNNVCNEVFSSGGLPNTDILGPSAQELLMAQLDLLVVLAEMDRLITEAGYPISRVSPRDEVVIQFWTTQCSSSDVNLQ